MGFYLNILNCTITILCVTLSIWSWWPGAATSATTEQQEPPEQKLDGGANRILGGPGETVRLFLFQQHHNYITTIITFRCWVELSSEAQHESILGSI